MTRHWTDEIEVWLAWQSEPTEDEWPGIWNEDAEKRPER